MRTTNTMMSLLLLSAVFVTPASANWFNNPNTNTNLNIGSAPNPAPADLRASKFAIAYATGTDAIAGQASTDPLMNMEGLPVSGSHGEGLGYILAVDLDSRLVELQTPRGIAIAMPESLVTQAYGLVIAHTTSRADVIAMSRTQTGRTVAINIDRRPFFFQG